MKKSLAFCMLTIFINVVQAQTWTWDSLVVSEMYVNLVKNGQGQVYSFSPHQNVLTKYSSSGTLLWTKTFSTGVQISNVICGNDQMVYLTGVFGGAFIAGSESAATTGADIFVAKFGDDGVLLWLRKISSKGDERSGDLCLYGSDKLLVTGSTADTTDFSGVIIPKGESRDLFVARYNLEGNFETAFFATYITGPLPVAFNGSQGLEIETDNAGNIILLAGINAKVQIDTTIFNDRYSAYFLKFDGAFHLLWSRKSETGYAMSVQNLMINSLNEIVYTFTNDAHYSWSGMLKKLSANGTTTTTYLTEDFGQVSGIDLDASDNIYFASNSTIIYSWSGDVPSKSFIHYGKIRPDGSREWEILDSAFSRRAGLDIAAGSSSIMVAGFFEDSISLFHDFVDLGVPRNFLAILNTEVNVNINDASIQSDFASYSVFPNPSDGIFTLKTNRSFSGSVCIYDVLGHCIYNRLFNGTSLQIDLSEAGKGIYFVQMETGETHINKKIIVN